MSPDEWPAIHAHPLDQPVELDLNGTGICSECGEGTDGSGTCPDCGLAM